MSDGSYSWVYQHGYGINREELRHAQLIPIDADLIHLQVDLGDFDALSSRYSQTSAVFQS